MRVILGLVLLFSLVAAEAALVVTDPNGRLIGARGVLIDDSYFDVDFVIATCAQVHSGCDDNDDFFFTTRQEAVDATRALHEQVLIDREEGNFFSDQSLHIKCNSRVCGYDTSFTMENDIQHRLIMATISYRDAEPRYLFVNEGLDGPNSTYRPKAVWSVSSVVPIPAAVWMFGSALAGLGWMRRKPTV